MSGAQGAGELSELYWQMPLARTGALGEKEWMSACLTSSLCRWLEAVLTIFHNLCLRRGIAVLFLSVARIFKQGFFFLAFPSLSSTMFIEKW